MAALTASASGADELQRTGGPNDAPGIYGAGILAIEDRRATELVERRVAHFILPERFRAESKLGGTSASLSA